MRRARRFGTALLALAVVTAAVYATGAFTGTTAERDTNVQVAGDGSAFLALQKSEGPNAAFASTGSNGVLEVRMSGAVGSGGTGVNPDSTTVFENVFTITNKGTQPVAVWFTGGNDAVTFIRSDGRSIEGRGGAVEISPGGDAVHVGLVIDARGVDPHTDLLQSVTIRTDSHVSGVPAGSVTDGGVGPGQQDAKSAAGNGGCGGLLENFWCNAGTAASGAADFTGDVTSGAVNTAGNLWNGAADLGDQGAGSMDEWWGGLSSGGFDEEVNDFISDPIGGTANAVGTLAYGVLDVADLGLDTAIDVGDWGIDMTIDGFDWVADGIMGLGDGIVDGMMNVGDGIADGIMGLGDDAVDGFVDVSDAAVDGIVDYTGPVGDFTAKHLDPYADAGMRGWDNGWDRVVNKTDANVDRVMSGGDDFVDEGIDGFDNTLDEQIRNWDRGFTDNLVGTGEDVLALFKGGIHGAAGMPGGPSHKIGCDSLTCVSTEDATSDYYLRGHVGIGATAEFLPYGVGDVMDIRDGYVNYDNGNTVGAAIDFGGVVVPLIGDMKSVSRMSELATFRRFDDARGLVRSGALDDLPKSKQKEMLAEFTDGASTPLLRRHDMSLDTVKTAKARGYNLNRMNYLIENRGISPGDMETFVENGASLTVVSTLREVGIESGRMAYVIEHADTAGFGISRYSDILNYCSHQKAQGNPDSTVESVCRRLPGTPP